MGQIAVVAEIGAIQPLAEPAHILAVAGDEDRHAGRTALGDADHSRRARAHAFDGLVAGVDLFDIDCRG
jgi:hypothetical protein